MAWQTPKTNWGAPDGVRDTDMNRIEGNILHLYTTDAVRNTIVVYVSASGSDTSGLGTSAAPYKTINKALSVIPKNLNGMSVSINIAAGTYSESVDILNFYGGTIALTGAPDVAVTVGGLRAINSVCTVSNITLTVNSASATAVTSGTGACITLGRPITIQSNTYGIQCNDGGVFIAKQTVSISNASIAVYATTQGRVHIGTLAGTGGALLFAADDGGQISYGAVTHTGHSALYSTLSGGRVYTGAQPSPAMY